MQIAQSMGRGTVELTATLARGVAEGAGRFRTTPTSWLAGALTIAPLIPILAGVLTVMFYVRAGEVEDWEIFAYTAAPVITLLIFVPLLFGRLATFEGANSSSSRELEARVDGLRARLRILQPGDAAGADETLAHAEAAACAELLAIEPERASLRWALGYGYINLWKILHRAEEALMYLEPPPVLVGRAQRDELRISGSEMGDTIQLQTALADARAALDATDAGVRHGARMRLCEVRHALNEFRDSRWSALVRDRNAANAGTICAGVVAYALLALAITRQADDGQIAVGMSFFFLGVLAGVLNRVFVKQPDELTVEDYGLSSARLMRTVVFSGLAAVGGVVIVAMTRASLNDIAPDAKFPALTSLFDVEQGAFRYVIAAIFGMSPERLLAFLDRQGGEIKRQLGSTEAAHPAGVAAAPART